VLPAAGLGLAARWAPPSQTRITPHREIELAHAPFGKKPAENTRETLRRQAIHRFVRSGVLLRKVDAPRLPIHSPRTHARLSTLTALREDGKRLAPRPATTAAQEVVLGFAAFRFCRKAGAIAPRAAS
jgi:hypothetical protein